MVLTALKFKKKLFSREGVYAALYCVLHGTIRLLILGKVPMLLCTVCGMELQRTGEQ